VLHDDGVRPSTGRFAPAQDEALFFMPSTVMPLSLLLILSLSKTHTLMQGMARHQSRLVSHSLKLTA
jgi:hypothetical protein